jgi:hypothetical protein
MKSAKEVDSSLFAAKNQIKKAWKNQAFFLCPLQSEPFGYLPAAA